MAFPLVQLSLKVFQQKEDEVEREPGCSISFEDLNSNTISSPLPAYKLIRVLRLRAKQTENVVERKGNPVKCRCSSMAQIKARCGTI